MLWLQRQTQYALRLKHAPSLIITNTKLLIHTAEVPVFLCFIHNQQVRRTYYLCRDKGDETEVALRHGLGLKSLQSTGDKTRLSKTFTSIKKKQILLKEIPSKLGKMASQMTIECHLRLHLLT